MLKIIALLIASAPLSPISEAAVAQSQATNSDSLAQERAAAEAIDLVKDPKAGRAAWEKVLAIAQARNRPLVEQAEIVNKIGDSYYYDQRPADAIKLLEDIVSRLRAGGEGSSAAMAESLSNLGLMYAEIGNPDRNIAFQKQALDIFERLKGADPARVASASINYAAALLDAGRAYEGAPYALHAVELYKQAGLRDATVAIATGTAANVAVLGGRAEVAIPLAEEAVRIAHEALPADNIYSGFAEATLGKALMMAGRLDEAEPHLRLAVDVLGKTAGRRAPLTLQVIQNLGLLLAQAGRLDEALELTAAAAEAQAGSKTLNDAQSLASASTYASYLGDEARAADLAKRAYDRVLASPGATGIIVALATRRYGEIEQAAGRLDVALPILARAADVAGAAMPDDNGGRNAQADIQLASAEIGAGKTTEGLARLQASVARLKQRVMRYAPLSDLSEDAFTYYGDFSTAASAAIDLGRLDLALEYQQLATWGLNARTAQQVVLRGRVARDGKLAALVRQVQEDARQARLLRRNHTTLVARGNSVSAASMAAEIDRLDARLARNEALLARRVPGYRESRNPAPVDLATIQKRLGADDSVLIAMPTRYDLLLFAITSSGATADKVPIGRGKISAMIADLRRSVDDGLADDGAAFDLAAAYRLHQAIFTPKIRAALRSGGTLYTLTDDVLAKLPLAMLVREPADRLSGAALGAAHWLLRDYAIETPISLASLGAEPARRAGRSSFVGVGAPILASSGDAAGVGAPLYRGSGAGRVDVAALPPLPNAQRELARMGAVIAPRHQLLLTGADATEARVRNIDWRGQSVVAFATHGLLAGEIGTTTEPALVLTPGAAPNGTDDDGLLTASEILTMKLDSDLVILSACNSASGISRVSAPYTGLANAFLFAGASSLLISHWPLRDDMAARLSVATVQGMRDGLSRAQALRQAQLAVLQDASLRGATHPAAWAGFVMVTR